MHLWAMLHTAKLYSAPYLATLHPTELHCILFFELRCTVLATLHPLICAEPHWAAPAFYWTITHLTELHCILLSYDAACWAPLSPYWAMLYPSELQGTFWAMLHLTEPRGTLLSYAAPYWAMLYPLSCAAPSWTKVHPAELHPPMS
jgi:hypothetical protein